MSKKLLTVLALLLLNGTTVYGTHLNTSQTQTKPAAPQNNTTYITTQNKPAPYNDHPAYNFHGEVDKTDIFAIPLDNSEEEQDEELGELEEGYPPKKG